MHAGMNLRLKAFPIDRKEEKASRARGKRETPSKSLPSRESSAISMKSIENTPSAGISKGPIIIVDVMFYSWESEIEN